MKEELYQVLDDKMFEAMANLHTATIARVTAVTGSTVSCIPVINRIVDGESIQLPEFVEVPLILMQGGGSYTVHPIAPGDYCMLIFTERCFDRWYAGQDFQPPLELRMHDYSDGFAIVGVRPASSGITVPNITTHQGDRINNGNYTNNGDVVINGNLTVNGDITCTGRITVAAATIGGIDFASHVHPENDSGGPTGTPQ